MTGYLLTAMAIGVIGGVMAVWQSLRPRVRSVDADPRARRSTETDPGKSAAWRMIRDTQKEGQL